MTENFRVTKNHSRENHRPGKESPQVKIAVTKDESLDKKRLSPRNENHSTRSETAVDFLPVRASNCNAKSELTKNHIPCYVQNLNKNGKG